MHRATGGPAAPAQPGGWPAGTGARWPRWSARRRRGVPTTAKVAEKEAKLRQSEEELYARHKEMKDQLDRQRAELEERKARIESGRPFDDGKTKKKGFSLRS